MSSTIDTLIWNPLERAIDQDLDDAHAYAGRHLGELLRFDAGLYDNGEAGGSGASQSGTMAKVGGLAMFASGTDVIVSPGYLMMLSSTIPSAIGALDSITRVGLLDANATIAIPDPGVDAYFLLQAVVSETITNENRDLFNTGTQTYDPPASIPKRKTHGITLTLKQGTATQIPEVDANQIPIGAFFKATAANLLDANIIDMRRRPSDHGGAPFLEQSATDSLTFPICQQVSTDFSAPSDLVTGRWSAMVNGFVASVQTRGALTMDATDFIDAGDAPAAWEWFYIYLGQNPRGLIAGTNRTGRVSNAYRDRNLQGNACFAISSVEPNAKGANGAAVALVRPFEGLTAPAGSMTCVGVLRRNAANNGWLHQRTSASGDVHIPMPSGEQIIVDQNSGVNDGTGNGRFITINLATAGSGGTRWAPANAIGIRGEVSQIDIDTTTGTKRIVQINTLISSGAPIETGHVGVWNTRERVANRISMFDAPVSLGDFLYLHLKAYSDADILVGATTAAIGITNRWALVPTGFRLR